LIQPIQDRIFKAIQDVSSEKKYAFVFDKANQSNLLFADPKYDISDLVLRKMGINVKKK
jgi:outer membrane protein